MALGTQSIRGIKVGAGPVGDIERGELAPSQTVSYYCANGHETSVSFAIGDEVEVPETWACRKCGFDAGQDPDSPPPPPSVEVFKTHLDYVKERRNAKDGEEILAEALSQVRERGLIR